MEKVLGKYLLDQFLNSRAGSGGQKMHRSLVIQFQRSQITRDLCISGGSNPAPARSRIRSIGDAEVPRDSAPWELKREGPVHPNGARSGSDRSRTSRAQGVADRLKTSPDHFWACLHYTGQSCFQC